MKIIKIILSIIVGFFVICFLIGFTRGLFENFGGSSKNEITQIKSEATQNKNENVMIDVNKFARITPEQLAQIMGEALRIESYPLDGYNFTNYIYGNYEFFVIDNQVVRMYIHSDNYNGNGASINYNDEKAIFEMLGITPSENIKKIADTPAALRYHLVSDNIAEVWVSMMDKKKGTIDEIKVTYNLNYFS